MMLTQIVCAKVLPLTIEFKCYIMGKKTNLILSSHSIDEMQHIKLNDERIFQTN